MLPLMSLIVQLLTLDFRQHTGPEPADGAAPTIITDCGNFTLKQREFCVSPDSGTSISQ